LLGCCFVLQVGLKGLVHITGGGMTENIPRVIPKGLGVNISTAAWQVPAMFQWMQKAGNVSEAEMRRTFNMGVGLVVVVEKSQVEAARAVNPALFELGVVVEGSGVTYV
jgi:phosphoribosylformylglycinamidine cyclo-ligase